MRAIVFANGVMDERPEGLGEFSPEDLIIAADGGLAHCLRLNAVPRVLVGDMDSVEESDLERMEASGVEIIRRPKKKDETDLELAIEIALERGAEEIVVVGALGARWDMTFGNVLSLGADYLDDIEVSILDGDIEITRIKGPGNVEFRGKPGDGLSIVPMAGKAEGITLEGLEYPLCDENLPFGSSRGLSNVFKSDTARIFLKKGALLVLVKRRGEYD